MNHEAAWQEDPLDALNAHIVVLDGNGIVLAVNQARNCFADTGQGQEHICDIGVSYLELILASARQGNEAASRIHDGLRKILTGEQSNFGLEYLCPSYDSPHWFLLQASRLQNGEGCAVAHIDITARKQAEEAQVRLGSILSATSDFVGIANPDGEVLYVNEAFRKLMSKRTRDGGLGYVTDYQPVWVTQKLLDEGFPEAARTGIWSGETAILTSNHDELPVHQVILAHRMADGTVDYFSTIMRDISQVRQRERELRQAYEELKWAQSQLLQSEKMASVGQLAAGVAHEINNPIGYVFSNLGHMQKYMDDLFVVLAAFDRAETSITDPVILDALAATKKDKDLAFLCEDMPNLLRESLEGINRVRKIVQDLRDFSRSGEHDAWEWFDLRQGLERTLSIVWNELKYKADVRRELGEIPDVFCLPSQLNQVFMNLLVNAAQAIDAHGTVTIRTWAKADQVYVEISDTGCGIKAEHLNRIFEPFFTTKPIGKGTGLGLSISYGIIQKHGGEIQVESPPGQGTTFRISLPVTRAEPNAQS